ncbi:MAG: sigma-70 family RNA polymerase sigma factor [Planctomycetes bacterium]|nr:sigma-70 family RNA polymerase sigma factor [Planctomycetota bacterium]
MAVPPTLELENLLREERWLRRLARQLVVDPNEAEDLVQDTWVAALSGPRAAGELTRAWTGAVLRNLWRDLLRGRERRERRERAVARDEASEPLDELAAELELRQLVGRCLLELAEPYRRTLTLRFLREQSLKALAKSEGISVTSAHERVERGLRELRARLDSERGGRRSWALGLMFLARPTGLAAATGLGGLAMGTGIKVGAALVVLVGLGAWFLRDARVAQEETSVVAGAVLGAREPEAEPEPLATLPAARRESVAETSSNASSSAREDAQAKLRGRVLDPLRAPLAGIPIALLAPLQGTEGPDVPQQASAADGAFEFVLAPGSPADLQPVALDPARATLQCEQRDGEWLLVLTGTTSLAGRVEDEGGMPVPGASLAVDVSPSYFRELGIAQPFERNGGTWVAESGANGAFALPNVPGGAPVELRAWAPDFRPRRVELPGHDDPALRVVLERQPDSVPLTGFVLDPAGRPVEGARVSAGHEITRTAADGGFALSWRPHDSYVIVRPDGASVRWSPTHVAAVHEGFAAARAELAQLDIAQPIVLRLGEDLALTGRVVDPAGQPLAGVVLWLSNPTPFGQEREGAGLGAPLALENVLRRGERGVVTSAEGSFTLDGLLPQEYRLLAYDPRTTVCGGPFPLPAGTRNAVLVLDRETGTARVAGRLVDADGNPLAGAMVHATRPISEDFSYEPPLPEGLDLDRTTDAEGRFEFERLAREGTKLAFMHPQCLCLQVSLEGFADLERLEVVAPRLCELQIDLGGRPELASRARILDADGRELWGVLSHGSWISAESSFPIQGKSEVVRVSQAAATLVLLKGGEEVARLPVALDPARLTVVGP